MADSTITMDTDWGAKGAQLTGAQVQTFIKDQFRSLQAKDNAQDSTLETLQTAVNNCATKTQVTALQNEDGKLASSISTLRNNMNAKDAELQAAINDLKNNQSSGSSASSSDVTALQNRCKSLEASVKALQDAQSNISATMATTSQITALQAKDEELQAAIDALQEQIDINGTYSKLLSRGYGIAYHRNSDGALMVATESEWPVLQNQGEVADGVAVCLTGYPPIIVAPEEAENILWATKYPLVNSCLTEDEALKDYNGKAWTANLMSNTSEYLGAGTIPQVISLAPGYCHRYSRTHNSDGKTLGIGIGKWWLPSAGEWNDLLRYASQINNCMSLISGATPISDHNYWTSSEGEASGMLSSEQSTVYISTNTISSLWITGVPKSYGTTNARPITAFE